MSRSSVRTGKPVAQHDLSHPKAVHHRNRDLVAAIAAIDQRGTGEVERDFRAHRFIGYERFLCACRCGKQQGSRERGWHDASDHGITQWLAI